MYTVPAKTNVQARSLISAIEKGEFSSLQPVLNDDDVSPRLRQPHPELAVAELAEPGTAKKLLLAFETKRKESLTSPTTPGSGVGRSLSSSGRGRLSQDRLSGFGEPVVQLVAVGEGTNGVVNGGGEGGHESVSVTAVSTTVTVNHEQHHHQEVFLSNGATDSQAQIDQTHYITTTTATTITAAHDDSTTDHTSSFSAPDVTDAVDKTLTVVTTTTSTSSSTLSSPSPSEHALPSTAAAVAAIHGLSLATVETTVSASGNQDSVRVATAEASVTAAGRHAAPVATAAGHEAAQAGGQARRRTVLLVTAFRRGETYLDTDLRDTTVRGFSEGEDGGCDVIVTDACRIARGPDGYDDYNDEMEKLARSDLVIFQYRTVLNTFPSALKAWLDNVLTDPRCGHLHGKKSLLIVTTDVDKAAHDPSIGALGDVDRYLAPIQTGVLRFVRLDVLKPLLVFGADQFMEENTKQEIIQQWAGRIGSIWAEQGI